jgi:hypothetical protein
MLIVARQKMESLIGARARTDTSKFAKFDMTFAPAATTRYAVSTITALSVDPYTGNHLRGGFLFVWFGPVPLGNGSVNVTSRAVGGPTWIPGVLLLIPPAIALRRRARTHRRRRLGLCLTCGYDLRGSAGDRCPECGAVTPARPRAMV